MAQKGRELRSDLYVKLRLSDDEGLSRLWMVILGPGT